MGQAVGWHPESLSTGSLSRWVRRGMHNQNERLCQPRPFLAAFRLTCSDPRAPRGGLSRLQGAETHSNEFWSTWGWLLSAKAPRRER